MPDKTQELREALAKWIFQRVFTNFNWEKMWDSASEEAKEVYRKEADQILHLLQEHGMVFKSNEDGEPKDLHFVEELDLKEKE